MINKIIIDVHSNNHVRVWYSINIFGEIRKIGCTLDLKRQDDGTSRSLLHNKVPLPSARISVDASVPQHRTVGQ